jgi:pyrroline-5-carboxylate reductase
MKKSLGFIGGGRNTRILLQGIGKSNVKFKRIIVTDANPIVIEKLKNEFPFIQADSASVAMAQDFVFLSLDQSMLMDTLGLLNNDISDDSIVISLAPDIDFAKLAFRVHNGDKIVKVIPVFTSWINEGFTPVSFSPGFPQSRKDDVFDFFKHFGKVLEVSEDKLQTYSIMSAVIPAYFWYQWQELINIGQEIGLTEQETIHLIDESVLPSFHLSHRSGLTQEQIIDIMPVNPIDENEPEIRRIYRSRLTELYRKARMELKQSTVTTVH